ncbi:MAG: DUF2029 domain-containing protein [Candidatus Dormibacteraeota bacterium]|nr:DUF2029 domain-containing protein [Candidatus Dormibacteraeota bacterium]
MANPEAPARRPLATRLFGVRLFFHSRSRQRVGLMLVILGAALYVGRAVTQLFLLRRELPNADFQWFYDAAVSVGAGRDPYQVFLRTRCPGGAHQWCYGGYIYPPLLAELLRPLAHFDVVTADAIWVLLSHAMLVAAGLVTYRAIARDLPIGGGAILLAAALFFLPIYQNLYSGSVGAPLVLLLALSAARFLEGGDAGAGAWLGVGAVLRVTPVAMAPLLIRGRADLRRPLGVVALVATGGALMLALAALTPYTVEYVTRVLPRLSGGSDVVSNVSLPGVLLRFQKAFLGGRFSELGLVLGTPLAVLFLAITWWQARGADGRAGRAAAFAAFLAVTALVSSITWNYHLVNEMLVFALLAPWLGRGRHALWLAVLAYPLLWIYSDGVLAATGLRPRGLLPASAFLVITSLNAIGMLMLWLACLDILRGLRRAGGAPVIR